MHRGRGGIDDPGRPITHLGQRQTFAPDPVGDTQPALGERMGPAALRVTPRHDFVGGVEIKNLGRKAVALELVEGARPGGEEQALARIDAQRDLVGRREMRRGQLRDVERQRDRQIIDAIEAEIFEYPQRRRPSRTRHAGDNNQPRRMRGLYFGRGSGGRPSLRGAAQITTRPPLLPRLGPGRFNAWCLLQG